MDTTQPIRLTFIEDPGHGWLEVPAELASMAGPYSGFSPRRAGKLYLEEDCDAPRFIDYAKARGWQLDITTKYVPHFAR